MIRTNINTKLFRVLLIIAVLLANTGLAGVAYAEDPIDTFKFVKIEGLHDARDIAEVDYANTAYASSSAMVSGEKALLTIALNDTQPVALEIYEYDGPADFAFSGTPEQQHNLTGILGNHLGTMVATHYYGNVDISVPLDPQIVPQERIIIQQEIQALINSTEPTLMDSEMIYGFSGNVFPGPGIMPFGLVPTPVEFISNLFLWEGRYQDESGIQQIAGGDYVLVVEPLYNDYKIYLSFTVRPPKEAIIFVPGLMGSEFIAEEDFVFAEEGISGAGGEYNEGEKVFFDIHRLSQHRFFPMLLTEEGISKYPLEPETNGYGALDTYRNLLLSLDAEFGAQIDVLFCPFDWRMDIREAAVRLSDKIVSGDYDLVTLIGHSTGGVVISGFIAGDITRAQKVNKVITVGTPYFGTAKSLYVVQTGQAGLVLFVPQFVEDWVVADSIKAVTRNSLEFVQLFPTLNYYSSKLSKLLVYNKIEISDFRNAQNFIGDLPWSKISSISGKEGDPKGFLDIAEAFHDELWIEGRHSLDYAESHLIYGDSLLQIEGVDYVTQLDVEPIYTRRGDGTTPVLSATLARLTNAVLIPTGYEHVEMIKNSNVLEVINRIIANQDYNGIIPPPFFTSDDAAKIQASCPVSLHVYEVNGEYIGGVEHHDLAVTNHNPAKADFYPHGDEMEKKTAFIISRNFDVVIVGEDDGTMDLSVGFEVFAPENTRVVTTSFDDVEFVQGTVMTIQVRDSVYMELNMDYDHDGSVDEIIYPTSIVYEDEDPGQQEPGDGDTYNLTSSLHSSEGGYIVGLPSAPVAVDELV